MTIVIFGNSNKRETIKAVDHILWFMRRNEVRVLLSNELRNEMNLREDYQAYHPERAEEIDFALSVGGDGTFLTTAMEVVEQNIPILGVNCGHLGFLADVKTDDLDDIMRKLVANDYTIEQRTMLQVSAKGSKSLLHPMALNEVAILKQELSSMITIETELNGEPIQNYRCDGLVISTPTGSTAYNLSVGGPISVPQAKVILLSPIASHSLNARPMVIPDDWKLDMRIHSRSGSFLISIDGRSQRLSEEVTLHIERSTHTVKLVQIGDHTFIDSLKTKLNWGV